MYLQNIKERVINLRIVIFTWVSRGLFESHKLIFSCNLVFKLLQKKAIPVKYDFKHALFEFLIFGQRKYGIENSLSGWLPDSAWNGLCKLQDLQGTGLERFVTDVIASPNRFKEWYLKQAPESSSLPLDWRKLDESDPLAKLAIIRCMRLTRQNDISINKFC